MKLGPGIRARALRYVLSLYFSIMTLTTVGYGDITATNIAEYARRPRARILRII